MSQSISRLYGRALQMPTVSLLSLTESFLFNHSLNDSKMDVSAVPAKCQLSLVWHPSVNAIKDKHLLLEMTS